MKRALIYTFLFISFFAFSQCSYDESCVISPAFPTICPIQLPDATVGEPYNTDLTFWMPVEFEAEGFEVVLDELVVTQISGLPIGLSVELSNSSMVFYPSENEFGCASVSGMPLASGEYTITVYVVANVIVPSVGFEIAYPTEFDLFINVNPGSGGNTSFTFSPSSGCEDLDVNFEALITSDEYDVEYIWDFDNGFSSNQQYPPTQTYQEPGDYNVTLITNLTSTLSTLNNFNINYTNSDCWGNDVEELCVDIPFIGESCISDPDLLIKLYDANGNLVYQTGGLGSNEYVTGTTASWSNINFTLNNPPYTVSIWDTENWDQLDFGVQFSEDDLLGSFTLNLEDGEHSFNSNCSSGTYSINSSVVPIQSIEASEVISVFENPELLTILNEDIYSIYIDYDNAVSYQWFVDGNSIEGANESTYLVSESGTYWVEFITQYGCVGTSIPLDVVKCDNEFSPSIFVSDNVLLTTDTDYEIDWYWNGVYYGVGSDINIDSDGYYWLIASDVYGCSWSSDTIFYQSQINDDLDNDGIINDNDDDVDGDGVINSEDDDVDGDGIPDDIDNDIDGDGIPNDEDDTISGYLIVDELINSVIKVFPNPSNGLLYIKLSNSNNSHLAKVTLRDMKGNLILDKDLKLMDSTPLDISFLPSSIYILNITIDNFYSSHQIIKE
ncbi:MAG: hypothetical protein CMP49_03510 [Flavobacteriales bacterium]|nr:hypothetical protein [Flavobacteriales bacterium]|tara:strand:- start:2432 stop:4435 length:2004 start_codon:yes stop_codon:yes gene_type:complete